MNTSRRRIFAALGGAWLALAYGAGGASAVGQTDEPPIEDGATEPAEVEGVVTGDDVDLEYTVSDSPIAFALVVLTDGDMRVMLEPDAVAEFPALNDAKDAGSPIAVCTALFKALGLEE